MRLIKDLEGKPYEEDRSLLFSVWRRPRGDIIAVCNLLLRGREGASVPTHPWGRVTELLVKRSLEEDWSETTLNSHLSHGHPWLPAWPFSLILTAGPRALAHQSWSLLENEAHKPHHTSFWVRYRHLTCSSSRQRGTRVQMLQRAILLQPPALTSSLASFTPVLPRAGFQDTQYACLSIWAAEPLTHSSSWHWGHPFSPVTITKGQSSLCPLLWLHLVALKSRTLVPPVAGTLGMKTAGPSKTIWRAIFWQSLFDLFMLNITSIVFNTEYIQIWLQSQHFPRF